MTSHFYVQRGFRADRNRQKERKKAARCGSVFRRDPTVAVTGFVKRATVEKREYFMSSIRLNTRLLFSTTCQPRIFAMSQQTDVSAANFSYSVPKVPRAPTGDMDFTASSLRHAFCGTVSLTCCAPYCLLCHKFSIISCL